MRTANVEYRTGNYESRSMSVTPANAGVSRTDWGFRHYGRNDKCICRGAPVCAPSMDSLKCQGRHAGLPLHGSSIFIFIYYFIPLAMIALSFLPSLAFADDKLTVYTVNYPLKYFAERIAGEHATVVFPAPADIDPAYWMPERKTISDYQKADLILLNGAHYAKWTEKVTLPQSKMIDTSKKFKDQYIKTTEAVTHSHGPKGEHAHEDVAFTIWLDFDLAVQQAKVIEKALIRKRPELRDNFQKNYAALEKDLMELDRKIKEIVYDNQNQPLMASHPVYDYLSRRYELNMKSVHWEPDEVPGNAQWMHLKKILKEHPARWMIWESKPLEDSVKQLESMGIRSIVFDPCKNVPDKVDFLEVMKKNIENLGMAFR